MWHETAVESDNGGSQYATSKVTTISGEFEAGQWGILDAETDEVRAIAPPWRLAAFL